MLLSVLEYEQNTPKRIETITGNWDSLLGSRDDRGRQTDRLLSGPWPSYWLESLTTGNRRHLP